MAYERDVPIADVPAELFSIFLDDLYHPETEAVSGSFSADELSDLERLNGLLNGACGLKVRSVVELLEQKEWQAIVTYAQELKDKWPQS